MMPNTIFDELFNGADGIMMYRAWVFPDIYPYERQPVLQNWSDEEMEEFCGRTPRR